MAEVTSCLQSQPRIKPVRGMRYVSAQNAKEGVCTCNSVVLSDVCNTSCHKMFTKNLKQEFSAATYDHRSKKKIVIVNVEAKRRP